MVKPCPISVFITAAIIILIGIVQMSWAVSMSTGRRRGEGGEVGGSRQKPSVTSGMDFEACPKDTNNKTGFLHEARCLRTQTVHQHSCSVAAIYSVTLTRTFNLAMVSISRYKEKTMIKNFQSFFIVEKEFLCNLI